MHQSFRDGFEKVALTDHKIMGSLIGRARKNSSLVNALLPEHGQARSLVSSLQKGNLPNEADMPPETVPFFKIVGKRFKRKQSNRNNYDI